MCTSYQYVGFEYHPTPATNALSLHDALPISYQPGATVFGLEPAERVSPEWAAWANGVAVRELDYHDTFLAADYSHPAEDRKSTRLNSSHVAISYAVFCLKKKKKHHK